MERRRDGEMACVGRKGRSARGNRTATEGTHPGADRSTLAVREPHVTRRVKVKPRPRVFTILSTRSRSAAVVIVRVSASRCSMCTESDAPGGLVSSKSPGAADTPVLLSHTVPDYQYFRLPPQASAPLAGAASLRRRQAALASTALTRRAAADRPAPRERAGEVKEKSSPVKKERPRCSLCVYRAQPAAQSTDEALSAAAW